MASDFKSSQEWQHPPPRTTCFPIATWFSEVSALERLMWHCPPAAQHMSRKTVRSGVNVNIIWSLEERLLRFGDKNRMVLMTRRVLYLTDHWRP